MPKIVVSHRSLGYEAHPQDYSCKKFAVVLIHGSGGDREDWRAQLEHDFRDAAVIAFELPGHGESTGPGENTIEAYSRWVADFVETLKLNNVVLIGCSLGSAIALWTAIYLRPAWLKGLGLVGSGVRLRVHPDFLNGLKNAPGSALHSLAEFCMSKKSTDLFDQVNARFAAVAPDLVYDDLIACDKFNVADDVKKIGVSTVIVVGKEDRLTPVKYSKLLNHEILGSTLSIIPEAGHLVMYEKPTEFNAVLENFITSLE